MFPRPLWLRMGHRLWGPRAGRPGRRLLLWSRWEVKWTGPHGARSAQLLWGLLEKDRGPGQLPRLGLELLKGSGDPLRGFVLA